MGKRRLAWLALLVLLTGCLAPWKAPRPRARNLLILTADSLRVDRLALWSGRGVATPALAELAARGRLYDNAWTVTPWTAPAIVSLFSGLYPPSHGAVQRDDATPAELPTLARLGAARSMQLGNYLFVSGASYFRNLGLPDPPRRMAHGREAGAFEAWLGQLGHDDEGRLPAFLAWIHLMEPHLPYGASGYRPTRVRVPGSSGLERSQLQTTVPVGSVEFEAGDRERLLALYDEDLSLLDAEIRRVLDALEAHDATRDTLIVFVADHGEELLEDGWVGHASTAVEAKLSPEILRIPLLLAGPGVPPGRDSRLAQQVDVLPTVAPLLGFRLPESVDGEDLLDGPGSREAVFFDSAVGGNLTPRERRGERLQGVSEGSCLLSVHIGGEGGADERFSARDLDGSGCAAEPQLRRSLAEWQAQQAAQRLRILERHGGDLRSPEDADTFAVGIEILEPPPDARLQHAAASGLLRFTWEGDAEAFWVEYRVGRGVGSVRGAFRIEGRHLALGPFPSGFWNDVARFGPFRYRILDAERRLRSSWRRFELIPVPQP